MDDLFLCRQIMRIYTCFGFDNKTHRLTYEMCPDLLVRYQNVEKFLEGSFSVNGIEMYKCGTLSDFAGNIKIVPQVFFIYKADRYCVPNALIERLSEFLSANGKKTQFCSSEISLYWGYTGRSFLRDKNEKLITDGLQRSDFNDIILDFDVFINSSYDMFHHRIVHELLHVLGISEEEMVQYIYSACVFTYGLESDWWIAVQRKMNDTYTRFKECVGDVQKKDEEMVSEIKYISGQLTERNLFYISMTEIDKSTMYHPVKLVPQVEIGGVSALFM